MAQANAKPDRLSEVNEATVHVAVQRTQRRDVEDGERVPCFVEAAVEQRQHGRHGFARTGGSHHDAFVACCQGRQRQILHGCWRPSSAVNRLLEGRVKRIEDRTHPRTSPESPARRP